MYQGITGQDPQLVSDAFCDRHGAPFYNILALDDRRDEYVPRPKYLGDMEQSLYICCGQKDVVELRIRFGSDDSAHD